MGAIAHTERTSKIVHVLMTKSETRASTDIRPRNLLAETLPGEAQGQLPFLFTTNTIFTIIFNPYYDKKLYCKNTLWPRCVNEMLY